jgi:hypothetical protein
MENRCSFQNALFLETLDDAQIKKKHSSKCNIPSSEPCRINFYFLLSFRFNIRHIFREINTSATFLLEFLVQFMTGLKTSSYSSPVPVQDYAVWPCVDSVSVFTHECFKYLEEFLGRRKTGTLTLHYGGRVMPLTALYKLQQKYSSSSST